MQPVAPVAIAPRAAKLPQDPPRNPRVYVDAFVVRNGVAQRVNTVDAKHLDPQQASLEEDYLAYDDEVEPQRLDYDDEDDYEDVQESRDRAKAVKEFSTAVDNFWDKQARRKPQTADYQNVHFGDRSLANQIRRSGVGESHQSLQRESARRPNRIPLPLPQGDEDDAEQTTTTEDPRKKLKPRVLPPTEHNPGQIDTVTVRVPPIYKEKRPRKLHRERPESPDREEERSDEASDSREREYHHNEDTDGEDSALAPQTEKPRRKRRRKQSRKARSAEESGEYSAGDYDYYGKKLPISEEEEFYRALTVPPPTKDADLARIEQGEEKNGHVLDEHERISEDPERSGEDERIDDSGRADDEGQSDSKERLVAEREDNKYRADDSERSGENERADEGERTDKLSPNAKVHETGYRNNYVHATNIQVDDPRPSVASVKKKSVSIGK